MRAPARGSLARQLLVAQVLVVTAMALAVGAAAAVFGPPAFERHMRLAGHADQPDVLSHGVEAFRSGLFTSLGAGIAIALAGAVLANVLINRRLDATVGELRRGSERVARGDYATPVAVDDGAHELKTVADSLNALAQQVGQTEATRRRMLTDLSHELRTPIATIAVMVEALEDGVAELDAETLDALRQQLTRLRRLAADMRDVSAFEEGRLPVDPAPAALGDVVRDALDVAAPRYEAVGVRLEATAVPPVRVAVDRERIGQVLDNLLRNALEHTSRGGVVRLESEVVGAAVRVRVADDGAGIRAEDLPHVFERFYRGDAGRRHDQGAGTGVGLTISRAIAEGHGGGLEARSDGPGRGATFVLTLPVLDS